MFNLYIDDISEIFDEKCDPVKIHDTKISHLLYADDLVLVSTTAEGLQYCLHATYEFSLRKELTINIEKSKTMIFSLAGRLINQSFTVNGEKLEPTHSFCYFLILHLVEPSVQ